MASNNRNWGMVIGNPPHKDDEDGELEVEMPMQIRYDQMRNVVLNSSDLNLELKSMKHQYNTESSVSIGQDIVIPIPTPTKLSLAEDISSPRQEPSANNTINNDLNSINASLSAVQLQEDSSVFSPSIFIHNKQKTVINRNNKEWIEAQKPEVLELVKEEFEHDDLTNMRERLRALARDEKEALKRRSKLARWLSSVRSWWGGNRYHRYLARFNPFARSLSVIEHRFGSGIATYYDFFYSVIRMNFFLSVSCFILLILPWLLRKPAEWPDVWNLDLFLGIIGSKSNMIGQTFFFFGGYEDRLVLFSTVIWPFAFVYIFVVILNFIIAIVIICRSIGAKVTNVRRADDRNIRYLSAVFNSFSFSVNTKQGVKDLQRYIAAKLQEYRNADFAKEAVVSSMTKKEIAILVLRRMIGISISGLIVLGTPVGVSFIVQYYDVIDATFPYTTSLLSSFISLFFPIIISYMVVLEAYAERSTSEWNIIIRTFIVKMSTTVALMIRQLFLSNDGGKCVQTEAGLVFWQMIWIEFGINMFKTIVFTPIRYKIGRQCTMKKSADEYEANRRGKLEFSVPDHVIELLYRQSLIFVGMIMSPMIPIAGLISNFILYFAKYLVMKYVCKFPDNPFERGRSSPFNLNMLLVTFVLCLVPLGFFLFQSSGNVCGPFRASILASEQMPVEAAMNSLSMAFAFYQDENAAMTWENILFYATHKITLGSLVALFLIISYFLAKFTSMFRLKYLAAEQRANLERKEKFLIVREYVHRTNVKYC
ncbi:hypothetical protein C9374_012759 [Naegleria lovaniensis]|uniref:TMC domain-containing protein n=1 Tax=Naegleria lovaniensis TaxID=51637 RepID=A0AA88G7N2_NAELO|nr:uncharacterized protein C9374_012759 [Naegleria lovaniensis]KAG2373157.1 hypothetical protein C9374_012759 [Naegleria lovaniensis]